MQVILALALAFAAPCIVSAHDHDELRLYDLTDLLNEARDFPPHALGAQLPAAASPGAPEARLNQTLTLDEFLDKFFDGVTASLIRGNAELRGGTTLFLRTTPAIHQHIGSMLAQARHQQSLQISIHAQLFLMDARLRQTRYALKGLGWKPLGDTGQAIAELNRDEARMVTETLSKDAAGVESPFSPSMTVLSGQLANSSLYHQRAYRPVSFPLLGGTENIAMLNLGDTVTVRANVTSDKLLIDLRFEHIRCALLDMKSIDLGAAGVCEEPVLWTGREHVDRILAAGTGASLIVATGIYLDTSTPRAGFLLIAPQLIDPDEKAVPGSTPPKPTPPAQLPAPRKAPPSIMGDNNF